MKHVKLIRIEHTSSHGTLGALVVEGAAFCATLELPDRGNMADVSSIPAGEYICSRTASPRFGMTFEVLDVPGRSHILFHAGNTDNDTHGCILLGQYWGKLGNDRAVLNSGNTFRKFMNAMVDEDDFRLTIEECY